MKLKCDPALYHPWRAAQTESVTHALSYNRLRSLKYCSAYKFTSSGVRIADGSLRCSQHA
jgi:hypothetical protein